jgi:hypothetical protein
VQKIDAIKNTSNFSDSEKASIIIGLNQQFQSRNQYTAMSITVKNTKIANTNVRAIHNIAVLSMGGYNYRASSNFALSNASDDVKSICTYSTIGIGALTTIDQAILTYQIGPVVDECIALAKTYSDLDTTINDLISDIDTNFDIMLGTDQDRAKAAKAKWQADNTKIKSDIAIITGRLNK